MKRIEPGYTKNCSRTGPASLKEISVTNCLILNWTQVLKQLKSSFLTKKTPVQPLMYSGSVMHKKIKFLNQIPPKELSAINQLLLKFSRFNSILLSQRRHQSNICICFHQEDTSQTSSQLKLSDVKIKSIIISNLTLGTSESLFQINHS